MKLTRSGEILVDSEERKAEGLLGNGLTVQIALAPFQDPVLSISAPPVPILCLRVQELAIALMAGKQDCSPEYRK